MHIVRCLIALMVISLLPVISLGQPGGIGTPGGGGGGGSFTPNSADTLTNKTINAGSNTLIGVGFQEISPDIISGYPLEPSPGAGMFFLINDGGVLKRVSIDSLPSAGQNNTASNVTSGGGVGLFKEKSAVDLRFKSLTPGSNKLSISSGTNDVSFDIVEANIQIGNLQSSPTGVVVGDIDSQTLTNKTINADNNAVTNVGSSEIKAEMIDGQTEDTTPTAGDMVLTTTGGLLRKVDVANLGIGGGSGQSNTGSNVGVGVGTFAGKNGVDLEHRSITAGSTKVDVSLNVDDIEIDVVPGQINMSEVGGYPGSAVVGISSVQTLTNKTINTSNNTIVVNEADIADLGSYLEAGTTATLTNKTIDTASNTITINEADISDLGAYITPSSTDTLTNKTINTVSNTITINESDISDLGAYLEAGTVATLTNKTIDADGVGNVITNIGSSEIKAEIVDGLTEDATPTTGEFVLGTVGGQLRKFDIGNFPGAAGTGEDNTASNSGVAGVGLFARKTGVDLELKNINTGSSKVSVTDDTGNDEVDIDIVESNIVINNLSGAPTGAVVGISDSQTLTNKTINTASNAITVQKSDISDYDGISASSVTTLTNKTIDADGAGNVITNIGSSEIKSEMVTGLIEDSTPATGHFVLGVDDANNLRKFDVSNWPTASSENTSASNQNTGGVGVFIQETGDDLEFRGINAGNGTMTVANDAVNNEIDLSVVPGAIAINSLSGAPIGPVVGSTDIQTLTNKTINTSNNTITIVESDISDLGAYITASSADTLSNKTIAAGSNTVTGITNTNIVAGLIDGQTEDTTPTTGDMVLMTTGGLLRKFNISNFPGFGGEANNAAGIGVGGVEVYHGKSGEQLQFKSINVGSSKLTVTDDTVNDEVDLDVAEANIVIGNLSGAPVGAVVGISDTQTLTNKTLDADNNTVTNIGSSEITADIVTGLSEDIDPVSGFYFLSVTDLGSLAKVDYANMGDITSVAGCTTGVCDGLVFSDGGIVDLSAVDMQNNSEGLWVGVDSISACALADGLGQMCYDSAANTFHIGTGTGTTLIGPTGSSATLDQVFDNGKVIDGANNQGNALVVGDGADGFRLYVGPSGPEIECFIGGGGCDANVDVPATHDFNLNLDGTTNSINIEADTGNVVLSGTLKEIKTAMVPAGMMSVDGVDCVRNSDVALNGETVLATVVCTDNDAGNGGDIFVEVPAPNMWDESTLTLEMVFVNLDSSPGGIVDYEWSGYCIGDNDIYGSNGYATPDANGTASLQMTGGGYVTNDVVVIPTAGQVPIGACSEGDIIRLRGRMDETGTTSGDTANMHLVWVKVKMAMNDWSD